MKVYATGSAVPPRRLTNDDLSRMVETSDQWIVERTGIRCRHISGEGSFPLAERAARAALGQGGIDPAQIGLVLAATFTPDRATPAAAAMLQSRLCLPEDVLAFDINSACSGFLYALITAERLLAAMPGRLALVVGAEAVSRTVDYTDRGTCILFGDGAGAAIVGLDGRPAYCDYGTRGNDTALYTDENNKLHMKGGEVYQFAVRTVPQSIRRALGRAGWRAEELDHILCHQANHRILEAVARHLGQPMDKFFENLAEYGNTSAASIPLALDEMNRGGLLRPGQKIALAGFGSGLSWGTYLFEW